MDTLQPQRTRRDSAARSAMRAALVVALLGVAITAAAADPRSAAFDEATPLAELEHAFWYCDYIATTEGVLAAPMAACRFATDELKKSKFGGDFNALLQWWRQNKPIEHLKIERLLDASPV